MNSNKKVFLNTAVIITLILFLAGCQTPVTLSRITFVKDFPLSGSITIIPSEPGRPREFLLSVEQDSYTFTFDPINARHVLVRLNHIASANPRERGNREAVITAEIGIKGGAQAYVKKGNVTLATGAVKGTHCNNLYDVSYHANALDIQFLGYKGLATCSGGKDFEKANPLLIGSRDVTKSGFLSIPNLFSSAQELTMGKQFTDDYVNKNREAILPRDHPTSIYMQEVMEQIVSVSDMPDLKPHVYVINADVLNAFALPGGYVFVFRGLMDAAESESQLVGVLGHEWAHVTARHGTKNMGRAILTTEATVLAGAALKSATEKMNRTAFLQSAESIIGSMLTQGSSLFLMHKSRKAELEADKIGSQYAWAAGFEPWGIAETFEVFKEKSGSGGSTTIEELFNTHPKYDTRIQNVHDLCAFYYPEKGNYIHTSNAFEEAKRELMELPLPSKEQTRNIGMGFANTVNDFVKNTVLKATSQHYYGDTDSRYRK